jgi:hypothetical protein
MKKRYLALFLVSLCTLVACQRQARLGNPKFLPGNWVTVKSTIWQVVKLPEVHKTELSDMKKRLTKERKGQYYNLFGQYKPETLAYIKMTTEELDEAYFNLQYSSEAILANLTPNLKTLGDTRGELDASNADVINVNNRAYQGDVESFWLLDKPSSLSVVPIVQE